jgi:hypothetical protein
MEHWEKCYGSLFDPCTGGHGVGQSGLVKRFTFEGVGLSEQRMAECLDTVRRDMVQLVLENEGQVTGEPRLTIVRGYLEGFEICYAQGKLKGTIKGKISATSVRWAAAGSWDFECEISEESANGWD